MIHSSAFSNKIIILDLKLSFIFILDEVYNQLYSAREKILYLETQRDMLTDRVSTLEERVEYWRYELRKVQRCGYYTSCKHKKELGKLKKVHAKCPLKNIIL